MSSTESNPLLGVACGTKITSWDISKSSLQTQASSIFDAKSLAGKGAGLEQFQPHGRDSVNDIAWNHSGQVFVSCSNSTSSSSLDNVVLTHFTTKKQIESFSNFHSSSLTSEATSISFGGKTAKSRYICISDKSGAASVWDMKKVARVRCFKMKNHDASSSSSARPSCLKACMDSTDTHVVALHGSSSSCSMNRIAIELFHLKSGSRVAVLQTKPYLYGGKASCFEFSSVDNKSLLVGTQDGSLLLWDCSVGAIQNLTQEKSINGIGVSDTPQLVLQNRHSDSVTDVAFSPINPMLVASCSKDGTVAFHDLESQKTVQTIRPWDHYNSNTEFAALKKGLTSFAFHHDGYTWAVGTESGLVFTYDLRQTGEGPLCTLDLRDDHSFDNSIKKLQFATIKSTSTSAVKSSIKKKISMGDDGAVTVEREKSTPTRKEITRTTYSMTKDDGPTDSSIPSTAFAKSNASIGSFSNLTGNSNLSGSRPESEKDSSRSEKVVKKTTTRRVVSSSSSSSPHRIDNSASSTTYKSPLARNLDDIAEGETKEEITSTSEVRTSSSMTPSTTKRIVKTKTVTSSPHRGKFSSYTSPTTTLDKSEPVSTAKKDVSVSFNDRVQSHVPSNDLVYGDNASDSSSEAADQMMEDFDAMYQRILKTSANTKQAAKTGQLEADDNDDDSGDGFLVDSKVNLSEPDLSQEPPTVVRTTKTDKSMTSGSNEIVSISKGQIEEMIEDAVESLREDVEESMQSMQLDLLQKIWKQTDEMKALISRIEELELENERLRSDNTILRKFDP